MSDSALQLTLREMRTLFTAPRAIGVMVAVIAMLGISGPFQTFEYLPTGPRLAYWAAMAVSTFVTGSFFGTWAMNALRRGQMPIFIRVVAGGFAAGLPVSLVVTATNVLTFGDLDLDASSVVATLGYSISISGIISLLFVLFERTKQSAEPAAGVKLLARLPLPKRGKLISLSVQDHYVAVTTTKGTALVLMRLSDAIGEADGVAGLQIHRSHWVAFDAVKATHRRNGKVAIETVAGVELPVSRSYMAAVRAAGLLV